MDMLGAHLADPMTLFPLSDENDFYYHATSMQIEFPLDANQNKGNFNDFGYWVYLGESFRQALTWGKPDYPTLVYCFRKTRLKQAKVLELDNSLEWLYFVGLNRGKISEHEYDRMNL